MDAFQIVAHTSRCFTVRHCLRFLKEFAQVRAGAKAWFLFAMDDQSMGILAHSLKVGGKFLQLLERERSNFIAWSAMQRQLNSTVAQIPRNGLSCVSQMLSLCPVQITNFEILSWFHPARLIAYIASISDLNCAEIKSRFNFPFAVSKPFSIENGSGCT